MALNSLRPDFIHPGVAPHYYQPHYVQPFQTGGMHGVSAPALVAPYHNGDHIDFANLEGRNAPSSLRNLFGV